jgi:hypothetical protein
MTSSLVFGTRRRRCGFDVSKIDETVCYRRAGKVPFEAQNSLYHCEGSGMPAFEVEARRRALRKQPFETQTHRRKTRVGHPAEKMEI